MKAWLVRLSPILSLILCVNFVPSSPSTTAAGFSLSVPVVFASRNHLDTINGEYVGPPVEVLGREKAVGGKLMVLYPDGRLSDLTSGKLFDVSRPMVSFDGARIVFSGIGNKTAQWHIYEINLNGTEFRQLTFDDRTFKIPVDPANPYLNQSLFGRYGDFSPAYLPDGRIVFSSSRYPSLSASCGQRALNLYVINGDGSEMHRITTERAGAIDPYVMSSGKIVYSHWVDNMNVPAPAGEGLQPLEPERNFASSFWILWSANPDGTGAGRYAFDGGKFQDKGGLFQPREMPDGRLVYTYRTAGNLLGSTLATSIAMLKPGDGTGNNISGIGDPSNLEAPHALSPTPLPDGRIIFSYTPSANVSTDNKNWTTARFNYGLYLIDDKFNDAHMLYDDPAQDELDAVAVYPRTAAGIADSPLTKQVTDDPAVNMGTTATLHNGNIYADLPLELREIPSPLAGSVVAVDFYDDSQAFTTSKEFPMTRKQPPHFIGSVPVNPDGSFTAVVPADRPIFFLLRTSTGVVNRAITSPPVQTYTSFVPTHDYFRPGQIAECVGCHRGHMVNPDLTLREGKTNLARLAVATASSSLDTSNNAAFRVNDNRLSDSKGKYAWASNKEKFPWVQLNWMAPVAVNEVVFYPRVQKNSRVGNAMLYFSDGTNIPVSLPLNGDSPFTLSFSSRKVSWIRLQVVSDNGTSLGLAEMVVHGDSSDIKLPNIPPSPPQGLTVTQGSITLNWLRNLEPDLAGYRVYYGISPGNYTKVLDVGNIDHLLMTGLTDNFTYFFAAKTYTLSGMESPGFSDEVQATFRAAHVDGLSTASGPTWGGTNVTISGSNFTKKVTVMFGGSHAKIQSVNSTAIVVMTPAGSAGAVNVLVINADGSRALLSKGFTYVKVK